MYLFIYLSINQSINQSISFYRAIVQRHVLQCGYTFWHLELLLGRGFSVM